MEWEEGGGGWDLLMLRSNEGFARVFDEGNFVARAHGCARVYNEGNFVARAHGCARVYNEGNFVARVFDDFNNRVPITQ